MVKVEWRRLSRVTNKSVALSYYILMPNTQPKTGQNVESVNILAWIAIVMYPFPECTDLITM